MKIAWALAAALLAFVSTLSPVVAQCGARVRKDWDAMTTAEKNTYKGALAAAMDSGAYIKFVEMHTEMQSEMEAHRQCMFIYWHRLLLVVFENMLRGQGSQYAGVTVPYYNWVGANNRVLAGTCSNLGDCSSIMTELGGYTTGTQRTVRINNIDNSGRCNNVFPLNHFCHTSFASVQQQIFNAKNIGEMSPNVESGCHNNVHASLEATMATFAAPADPIFWSHHAMVDALHTIFHKCRVGTDRLTFAQKAAHPVAWTSCSKRNGGSFSPTEVIVTRTGVNGNNPIQGSQDPIIGRYFTGVPNQFAGLMDVRDLGDSSYTYELSGQLADMCNNCDGTPSPTTAAPTTAPVPTTATPTSAPVPTTAAPVPTTAAPVPTTAAPVPTTAAPVPTTAAPIPTTAAPRAPAPAPWMPFPTPAPAPRRPIWGLPSWFRSLWGNRRLEAEHGSSYNPAPYTAPVTHNAATVSSTNTHVNTNVVSATTVRAANASPLCTPTSASTPTTVAPSPQYDGNMNNNVDVILVNKKCSSEKKVSDWYDKTMSAMGGRCPQAMADLERQTCMFEDQCLGGSPEYSDQFKATWGVKEPRCLTIVNAIKSGQQKIHYVNWRKDMEAHFGCPKPANATQPAY
ncbi:hypothetical protein PF003_g16869 [Phytophthora fragariae]|nr:hypothetical protein PF003_g16869 [Phytophthora fragariae]